MSVKKAPCLLTSRHEHIHVFHHLEKRQSASIATQSKEEGLKYNRNDEVLYTLRPAEKLLPVSFEERF